MRHEYIIEFRSLVEWIERKIGFSASSINKSNDWGPEQSDSLNSPNCYRM